MERSLSVYNFQFSKTTVLFDAESGSSERSRASWNVENRVIVDFLSRLLIEFIPSFCLDEGIGKTSHNQILVCNTSITGKANKYTLFSKECWARKQENRPNLTKRAAFFLYVASHYAHNFLSLIRKMTLCIQHMLHITKELNKSKFQGSEETSNLWQTLQINSYDVEQPNKLIIEVF